MADYQRGIVKRITFEIEYPDGSRKTAEIEDADDIELIAFRDSRVEPGDVDALNVSDSDWTQNPAMIIYRDETPEGIPFCTHNGCKQ